MVNKSNLIAKKWYGHIKHQLKGLIKESGQGLCNSKSIYKVDVHICMMKTVI